MKWIKRFWRKCLTYFNSPLQNKITKVDEDGGAAVLFSLVNNKLDFDIDTANHTEVGKIMGCLSSRSDMDNLLVRILQLDCYKDTNNVQCFLSGFGLTYKEELVTPETAFLNIKTRSIQ